MYWLRTSAIITVFIASAFLPQILSHPLVKCPEYLCGIGGALASTNNEGKWPLAPPKINSDRNLEEPPLYVVVQPGRVDVAVGGGGKKNHVSVVSSTNSNYGHHRGEPPLFEVELPDQITDGTKHFGNRQNLLPPGETIIGIKPSYIVNAPKQQPCPENQGIGHGDKCREIE